MAKDVGGPSRDDVRLPMEEVQIGGIQKSVAFASGEKRV